MANEGKEFATVSPATDARLKTYCYHSEGEREALLQRAASAFQSWRREPVARRLEPLHALGGLLKADAGRLGRLATDEMGKPLAQGVKEVEKCATACAYYGDNAERLLADQSVATEARATFVAQRPLGVVLSIMPWNFPFWQVVRFAVPAITAGNVVVMKHADNTTGCGLALEELFLRAGFPKGVFQALLMNHEDVRRVIEHPVVQAVTLTGSERAGRAVGAAAGGALKKCVLELGGSDAYIVLADADIEAAARICVDARLVNNGQSCVAAKRFIVVNSVYERFKDAFVAAASRKTLGDPSDVANDVGPLAKAGIRDDVARQVSESVAIGAKLLLGGEAKLGAGNYFPVTVLGEVVPGMPAFDEEVFGPAAALIRARDEADAVRLANAHRYGLGGAVFSRDEARARRIAVEELDAGIVAVNGQVVSDARVPFGGVKASGFGRELGEFGMREFVNVKTVVVN